LGVEDQLQGKGSREAAGEPLRIVPWPITREDALLGIPARDASHRSLRRDSTFRRMLLLADVLASAAAFALPVIAAGADGVKLGALLAVIAVVGAAKVFGLYDRDELVFHKATLDEAPALFHLATLYALVVWVLHGELLSGSVGRNEILLFWGGFFLIDVVLRFLGRRAARMIAEPERCLIVGKSDARIRLAAKLAQAHTSIEIVGSLPLTEERATGPGEWEGRDRRRRNLHIEDLGGVVAELDIHRVIVMPGTGDPDEMLDSIGRAKSIGVKISVVPRLFEVVGSSVEFDDLEGLTVLGVRRFGLSRSSALLKRGGDIVASGLLLLVLAPLFALVALLIRLDTPGPVFFRQTRVGLDGREFAMLKFRSMVVGAHAQRDSLRHLNESEGLFKIERDPRVTRVGRVLRRAGFDELPQLINVLRGEMSLVGPRPLVVDEDRFIEGRHRRGRLQLVPGMTGPWQLLGPARVPLNEMVAIDYLYGANWSLWNDVKILLRTIAYVINRRGM
jgi:exopolysaccharide biosynthesis polyprenyl glycosylphosphotransferase